MAEKSQAAIGRRQGDAWVYTPEVQELLDLLTHSALTDKEYDPARHRSLLEDRQYINQASLEELRPLFTFCVRSERLSEGSFGHFMMKGDLGRLCARLEQLLQK